MRSSGTKIVMVALVLLLALAAFAQPASAQTSTPLATGWVYDPSTGSKVFYVIDEPVYRSGAEWHTYRGYVYYGDVHYTPASNPSSTSSGWDSNNWLSQSARNVAHLGRMWGWW